MEEKLSFATIAGGGVEEKLQYALSEVAANIADPNTDAKKARKVTMTLTIKPNESRMIANVDIDVKTSLAAPVGISTTLMIDRDKEGKVVASEIYGKDPKQQTVD
nr:replication terminator protein [Alphaproteobacteria bacterium]